MFLLHMASSLREIIFDSTSREGKSKGREPFREERIGFPFSFRYARLPFNDHATAGVFSRSIMIFSFMTFPFLSQTIRSFNESHSFKFLPRLIPRVRVDAVNFSSESSHRQGSFRKYHLFLCSIKEDKKFGDDFFERNLS